MIRPYDQIDESLGKTINQSKDRERTITQATGNGLFDVGSVPSYVLSGQFFQINQATMSTMNQQPLKDNTYFLGTTQNRFKEIHSVITVTGDLCFEETKCEVCGASFKRGDSMSLYVLGVFNDRTHAVPIHARCGTV